MKNRLLCISRRQWDILFVAVLLLGSLFIVASCAQPGQRLASESPPAEPEQTSPAPLPNHPAPSFTLTRLDGTTVALDDLRGQVVLVHVWATWCPPCRAEIPLIQSAYEEYQAQGFTVLALSVREEADTVGAFVQEYDMTFPVLLDYNGTVSTAYRAHTLPSSFFVDRRGVIRAVYRGPMPHSVIEGMVAQLVQEEA